MSDSLGLTWIAAWQASLSFTNSQSLLKLMSITLVIPSNHLLLCHRLVFQPSFFPSLGVFSSESVLASGGQSTGVSASTSVLPVYIQDWISYSIDWLDLLAVQGTLKSPLQPQFKTSILWCSASLWSNSHIHIWLLEKPQLWLVESLLAKYCLCFLVGCLDLSWLFFQRVSIFQFHGCSKNYQQWFWSTRT